MRRWNRNDNLAELRSAVKYKHYKHYKKHCNNTDE